MHANREGIAGWPAPGRQGRSHGHKTDLEGPELHAPRLSPHTVLTLRDGYHNDVRYRMKASE